MDVSDIDNKLEKTQEAESTAVDELVRERVKDENSDPAEDFEDEKDYDNSEKLDPVAETEPSLDLTSKPVESLPDEFTQVAEDPVGIEQSLSETNGTYEAAVEDYVSKEIDSVSGQNGYSDPTPSQVSEVVEPDSMSGENGYSDPTPSQVSEGVGPPSDETYGLSSKETTLPDSVITNVPKSVDVGDSEVPHCTEDQGYIAVTPLPLQRTSWRECCGLFKVLRRSDQ